MLPWMYNFAFSETYTKQINLYRLHHHNIYASISELQPNINNEVSYSRGLIHNWYFNFKNHSFTGTDHKSRKMIKYNLKWDESKQLMHTKR